MIRHWRVRLHGQVQGVGLRAQAARQARALGLTGFIGNDADGSVYLEIEGEREELEKFGDWLLHGEHLAKVTKFEINEGTLQHYPDFTTR